MPASLNENFTIAVIGAGAQGADLALLAVRAGFRTVVEDVFPSKLRSLKEHLQSELAGTLIDRVRFAGSIEEAVREADFAMDSVPDELESKLEIFSLLDRMAPPRTIICSPLESVSVSDLASCTYRAELCIGVQALDGSALGNTTAVRLLRSRLCSDDTAQQAQLVWQRMGKRVEIVMDVAVPGFGS